MRFTKKFFVGLVSSFVGLLSAFDMLNDYRNLPILIFWVSMSAALAGLVLMFRGIEATRERDQDAGAE